MSLPVLEFTNILSLFMCACMFVFTQLVAEGANSGEFTVFMCFGPGPWRCHPGQRSAFRAVEAGWCIERSCGGALSAHLHPAGPTGQLQRCAERGF